MDQASNRRAELEELGVQCLERMRVDGDTALEAFCSEHPNHAEEIREIVACLSRIGLIEAPAELTAPPPENQLGEQIGEYRLIELIGRGGMGEVFLAEQQRLGRKVALKLIRPDYLRFKKSKERFRREIEAVTRLDHPGICTVYDAGEVDGTPFLAMRYIEGETLAQRLAAIRRDEAGSQTRSQRTPTVQRAELLGTIKLIEGAARALHYAHEQGLIHRDIKPGNLMITSEGQPVLLDFGLAVQDSGVDQQLTLSGDVVGTPVYMAPEQLERDRTVDRRSDVYGLGATLYAAITLRPPHEGATLAEICERVQHGEITAASKINRMVTRELDIVLETALDPEVHRRYRTALEFAEDLRRVREHEPIHARRLPPALRAKRWVQRNPVMATFAGLTLVGLALTSWFLVTLTDSLSFSRALNLAAESDKALAHDVTLALALARSAIELDDNLETRSQLQRVLVEHHPVGFLPLGPNENWWRETKYALNGKRFATIGFRAGRIGVWNTSGKPLIFVKTRLMPNARPDWSLSPSGNHLLVVWDSIARFWDLEKTEPPVELPVRHATWTENGNALVFLDDSSIRLVDAKGAPLEVVYSGSNTSAAVLVKSTPDLRHTAAVFDDGSLRVWSQDRASLETYPGMDRKTTAEGWVPAHLAFSNAGRRAAAVLHVPTATDAGHGFIRGRVVIWDLDAPEDPAVRLRPDPEKDPFDPAKDPFTHVTFSPTGSFLTVPSIHREDRVVRYVKLWDEDLNFIKDIVCPGVAEATVSIGPRVTPQWSPSGNRFFTVFSQGLLSLWDENGDHIYAINDSRGIVTSVAFSDRDRLLFASRDGTTHLIDTGGNSLASYHGHWNDVELVTPSPDGTRFVTLANAAGGRVWNTFTPGLPRPVGLATTITRVTASFDRIATGCPLDCTWRVWDRNNSELLAELRAPEHPAGTSGDSRSMRSELSADGQFLLTASAFAGNSSAHLWRVQSKTIVKSFGQRRDVAITCVRFARGANMILTSIESRDGSGAAYLWSSQGNKQLSIATPHGVVSADVNAGATRAVLSYGNLCRLWRIDRDRVVGDPIDLPIPPDDQAWDVCFSTDGTKILAGLNSGAVLLWSSTDNWESALVTRTQLTGHESHVNMVAFSPDDTQAASISLDGSARVWDLKSNSVGKAVSVLRPSRSAGIGPSKGAGLCFTPDGRSILTATIDRRVRSWFARTEDLIRRADEHLALRGMTESQRKKYASLLGDR